MNAHLTGLGYWYDWEGKRQSYWDGSDPGKAVCACNAAGDCHESAAGDEKAACNCDAAPKMDHWMLTDTGTITNMTGTRFTIILSSLDSLDDRSLLALQPCPSRPSPTASCT